MNAPWMRRFAEVRAEASRPGHDPALEGVRGLAVALVFLVHVRRIVSPLSPDDSAVQFVLAAVSVAGQAGVHLFFVLSGFLIYGLLLDRRPSYPRFLWRRIQRIYPTFLAVMALYLAVSLVLPSVSKLPTGAAAVAEYLARSLVLLPGLGPQPALIAVEWTLRYEMAFYILVGLLTFAPAYFLLSRPIRMAAATSLLPFALWDGFTGPTTPFVFGILAREVYGALEGRRVRTTVLAWLTMVALAPAALYKFLPELAADYPELLASIANASHRQRYLILDATLLAFVLLAALGGNPIARLAAWKPVRAFGIVSYSYYLSHGIAIHVMEAGAVRLGLAEHRSLAIGAAVFAASFALSVVLAVGLFLAVEYPASIRKRIVY